MNCKHLPPHQNSILASRICSGFVWSDIELRVLASRPLTKACCRYLQRSPLLPPMAAMEQVIGRHCAFLLLTHRVSRFINRYGGYRD